MRRKSNNWMWTFFITLALIGSGVATTPRAVRADIDSGGVPLPSPPEPGIGDPDFPTNTSRMPKPGPQRGAAHQPTMREFAHSSPLAMWWSGVRMAFATVFRVFRP